MPRQQASKAKAKAKVKAKAKAKVKAKATFKPVSTDMSFVVCGGLLRKPVCVDIAHFDGDKFVKITKREAWLCQLIAGKARGLDPLSRTTLIEQLSQGLKDTMSRAPAGTAMPGAPSSQAAVEDPMLALDLDDAEAVAPPAPKTKKLQSNAPVVVHVPAKSPYEDAPCASSGGPPTLKMLSRAPKAAALRHGIYLHVDLLPWCCQKLRLQYEQGGVTYSPPDASLRQPWFSRSDCAWYCRAKTPAGGIVRKKVAVPTFSETGPARRSLSFKEFASAKQEKLAAIKEWREAIQLGFAETA